MPFIKISGLTTATAVSATNQFEINQNGASRSLEVSVLDSYIRTTSPLPVVVSVSSSTDALRVTQFGGGTAVNVVGNMVLSGQTTADQFIRIGSGRSGNGNSYLDLKGDTTYDAGLRLIRKNTGANANSTIEHRGTGPLELFTVEAGPILLVTDEVERMRITGDGSILSANGAYYGPSAAGPRVLMGPATGDTHTLMLQFGSSRPYNFALQGDRNIVLYDGATSIWSTGTAVSDRKLKDDIRPTAISGVETISRLPVVDYQWKETSPLADGGKTHTGFIAQDVAEVLPDAVKDVSGTLLLHKEEIIPALVKAVQELTAEVMALKARVAALENG